MARELLKRLPNVDQLLKSDSLVDLITRIPRTLVLDVIREVLDERRQSLLSGKGDETLVEVDGITRAVQAGVERRLTPGLNYVVNATGVVLHTNLGRAPIGARFLAEASEIAAGYSNLEYSLEERKRGSRYHHTDDLLQRLTGAEASVVVNNNAAAMVLMLAALCRDKEAIVSRGELIEIGGSFRLPEIFEAGGAHLREVGTTNRTHMKDYKRAICADTGMILKVHRSNFDIVGFTKEVNAQELAELGREHGIPVCEDLGCGCLVDLSPWGIDTVTAAGQVSRGLDLVTFSGDKILGGPQAGIIVGRGDLIARIKQHPLTRALRVDKLTLATLERTLLSYVDGSWRQEIPALSMLTASADDLKARAEAVSNRLVSRFGAAVTVSVEPSQGRVGGGSLPLVVLDGFSVRVALSSRSAVKVEKGLRLGKPAIVCRLDNDALVFDVRTVFDTDWEHIETRLSSLLCE